jgi:hypothetical protein
MMIGGYVHAHQFTPTYPTLSPSYVEGIWSTNMKLFNARKEITHYKISVLDKDGHPINFVTDGDFVRKILFSETHNINIYIRENDKDRVTYICSESKILKDQNDINLTNVVSRICSKVK